MKAPRCFVRCKDCLLEALAGTWPGRWFLTLLNSFSSLLLARDICYLVGLMVFLLFLDVAVVRWGKTVFSTSAWGMVFDNLFSVSFWASQWSKLSSPDVLGQAFGNLFSAETAARHWFTMVLFFVVWLIGGGVLVSVMVGQYYKNKAGGFRRWPFLVKNHVVVLGWDDGILAELKQAVSNKKHECYIVTRQNVPELEQSLKGAGIKDTYIYRGDYDNPEEWRDNLQIHKAAKVFIAGERDEAAHDARVQMLFEKIKEMHLSATIKVNLHDFGLARKFMKTDGGHVYENFHSRWAKTLWEKAGETLQGGYSLFVVGFGAMGKAIVLEAVGLKSAPSSIVVTDDDSEKPEKFESEKKRFERQFPNIAKDITFYPSWDVGLQTIINAYGTHAVIVVAKKRSEKGMLCMMDIVSKIGDAILSKTQLFLNQEVDGYVFKEGKDEGGIMRIGAVTIQLFGMKKGC